MESWIVTLAGCGRQHEIYKMDTMEIKQTSTSPPSLTMINKLVKLLPLLAIAVAVPTFAASNHSSFNHGHGQLAEGPMGDRLNDLNLTPEQKTKLDQLRSATKAQMDAVFTPEQRQKLQEIKSQRQANRAGRERLNLTTEQKAQLKAIHQNTRTKMKALLTPEQQALWREGGGRHHHGRDGHGGPEDGGQMDKLNLTAEQKAKMAELRAAAKTQMDAVLTPEQQQQAQLGKERRRAMRDSWQSLNLTPEQKTKLKAIRESSKQQFDAILTSEQKAKLKAKHHGGRYHRM
jgi:Spy/CpxP family protein refolding chaperone